jgi:hypothetical protein
LVASFVNPPSILKNKEKRREHTTCMPLERLRKTCSDHAHSSL